MNLNFINKTNLQKYKESFNNIEYSIFVGELNVIMQNLGSDSINSSKEDILKII